MFDYTASDAGDLTAQYAQVLVEGLAGAARVQAMTEAILVTQIAELAAIRRTQAVAEARARRGAGRTYWGDADAVERAIADEVAAALNLSPVAAGQRVDAAEAPVHRAPATLEALADARIDAARAHRIAEGVRLLDGPVAARVEADVLTRAPHQTPAQVSAGVRRAVIAADPAAATRAYQRALRTRHARIRPEDDGMASLWLTGRADRVTAAWQTATAIGLHRVDLAKAAASGDQTGDAGLERLTLEQARADAMLDLLASPDGLPDDGAPVPPIPVEVHVLVTAEDLLHANPSSTQPASTQPTSTQPTSTRPTSTQPRHSPNDARPAEMAGYGPIPGGLLADLLDRASPTPPDGSPRDPSLAPVRFTRWLLDPRGLVSDRGTRRYSTYRPPEPLDAVIRARDTSCRFPGCSTPADRCDVDHVVPYPRGSTEAANLAALCRRHHRLKTHNRWRVRQLPGAVVEWTSPTGHMYVTQPPTWTRTYPIPKPAAPIHRDPTPGPTAEPVPSDEQGTRVSEQAPF